MRTTRLPILSTVVETFYSEAALADRIRLSHGVDYVLRLMRIYTDMMDGDVVRAIIFLAAARAGTQHLKTDFRPTKSGFVDDALRRPISISALARSLGLPNETVRRHVNALVAAGYAARTPGGGVIVTSHDLDRPDVQEAVGKNVTNLERLTRALRETPRRVAPAAPVRPRREGFTPR
jgi:hypothetical protein